MESTRVKLARQALESHRAKLRTAARGERDGIKRQIAAAEQRYRRTLERESEQ